MNQECEGFTLSSGFKCILHKTANSLHFTGRKISHAGIRNRTALFPKYCKEEQRLKRCKNEPKCGEIINCLRNGYHIVRSPNLGPSWFKFGNALTHFN